jgi:hypothetical protein
LDTDSDAKREVELRDSTNVAPATSRSESKTRLAETEAVERRMVVDETEVQKKEHVDRESKTKDMQLLPQPAANTPVPTNRNTDRSDKESPSVGGNEGAPIALTEQAAQLVLEQMLLLPMVPDSGTDQQLTSRAMIAGFNPVAMLQIFVGAEPADSQREGLESEVVASRVGETEIASTSWVRMDRLAVATFVLVVGYWYFHSEDKVSSSTAFPSVARDRRPSRWRRLLLGENFGAK